MYKGIVRILGFKRIADKRTLQYADKRTGDFYLETQLGDIIGYNEEEEEALTQGSYKDI